VRDFIKRHWLAYLIGVFVAIGVGALAAYVVGIKASTPAEVRRERIAAEKAQQSFYDGQDPAADDLPTEGESE